MISYFQITGSGVTSANVAEFIQKMTSLLTSQGYRVYSGDPSLNGCPFDFSTFDYHPEPDSRYPEMFLVIMNDYDDMCRSDDNDFLTIDSDFQSNGNNGAICY